MRSSTLVVIDIDPRIRATRRHEFWSIDVRYIEHHQLPGVKGPVYVISIMRRLADYYLNRATSWGEIRSAHRKFIRDYNTQSDPT